MLSMSFGTLFVPWKQVTLDNNPAAALLWTVSVVVVFTLYFSRGATDKGAARTLWSLTAWTLLSIAPVYTWFYISPELEGGRYLYVAAPAWAMLLTACLATVGTRLGPRHGWAHDSGP